MDKYPFDMIRTIARNFYIRPSEWSHSGMDWTFKNEEWEMLADSDKQVWYDVAIRWLDTWEKQSPELYNSYIQNWVSDLNTDGYNILASVKPAVF